MLRGVEESDKAVIVVVSSKECPACQEYMPRFLQMDQYYNPDTPVFVVDIDGVGKNGPESKFKWDEWFYKFKINVLPTTLVLRRNQMRSTGAQGGYKSFEGGLDNNQIKKVFDLARNV